MKPLRSGADRWRTTAAQLLLAINVLGLVAVAVWFRARSLENIPGTNGDEAWYGVQALQILRGRQFHVQTPTGNPPNPFFLGPVVLLHVFLRPSIALLRLVAVLSGMLALAVNWLLCRWVFDRRTATISTVILAILPINIAYSRFAWDASQSVAATLPVLYFSLAAVRFHQRQGQLIVAAIAAQIIAALVHPTNIFAGAAIAVALAVRLRSKKGDGSLLPKLVLATILLTVLALNWTGTSGPLRFVRRMGEVKQLVDPRGQPHFSAVYARLFTGSTVYRYIPGTRSWLEWPSAEGTEGWGIDVVLFWIVLAAAVWFLWRSWKAEGRLEDRVLIWAWALGLLAFLLLAGPRAITPGWERWAMCLVGPAVVLAARGGALCLDASSRRRRLALAAASLAGWLVLADYQQHYFAFIERTGGRSHRTFCTAAVEPKQAALQSILRHREPGTAWIVTSQWWNYWPLRYLGMAEKDVHVVTPEEAETSAEFELAVKDGRVWYVEFSQSKALRRARAALAGRELRQWDFADYSGRPVLCVLHGE